MVARPTLRRGLVATLARLLVVGVALPATLAAQGDGRRERGERRRGENFEARGVTVGERLDDLEVYGLDGTPRGLAELWAERPLLLVTASITCPPSRESMAEVEAIRERFADQLAVAVLYTLEAHPVGESSPYRPGAPEWVPPINVKAGFERRQPHSLEERLELARELVERLAVHAPVLVDGMDDEGWRTLGGGPNVGLLIETDGTVAVKHGWFDGPTMANSIEAELGVGAAGP